MTMEQLQAERDAAINQLRQDYGVELGEKKPDNMKKVVFCKDCQFHHWHQDPCHGKTIHTCDTLDTEVTRDFYCAAGFPKA